MTTVPEIHFATLDDCHRYDDVVVVIDVVRAFSTAAYAFGSGAERILLVGTVEEALALRDRHNQNGEPPALVMGEVGGLPVPGFDLWNSPVQVSEMDLTGRTLVQRTSAGTQGVVRASAAEHLFAASFAVAGATVAAVRRLKPRSVAFVITGLHPGEPEYGREDMACAEYMAALLRGEPALPDLAWVDAFIRDRLAEAPSESIRSAFQADLALCRRVDAFPFALPITRRSTLLTMQKDAALSNDTTGHPPLPHNS